MTNLDNILKSRDITLLRKVCIVKAMVFPVVTYGCERWTLKAEQRRINAFELWCWRRLLRVPWTARRSNQSILKEITLGCLLEGLMFMLKLQYFGHQMRRGESFEKTLMRGMIEGRRKRGRQKMWWLDGITNSMDMGLGRPGSWLWTGRPDVLQFMGLQRVGQDWATELNYLHCPSEWVCFPERVATADSLNEGKAQFDSLPDKLQGMPAVFHCFRWLLIPWN